MEAAFQIVLMAAILLLVIGTIGDDENQEAKNVYGLLAAVAIVAEVITFIA